MRTPTKTPTIPPESELATIWANGKQIRLWIGILQGRKGLLPKSTWDRWRIQLRLTGTVLYSPAQFRLICEFNEWLASGGCVVEFQRLHNLVEDNTNATDNRERETVSPHRYGEELKNCKIF